MADTLTINGTPINLAATITNIDHLTPFVKGGIPELHFSRLLGPLAALPDPWSLQPVTLDMAAASPARVFSGDVAGYVDRWMDDLGWVREYRALGLINRANYIPMTDSETLTDTSVWNLPGDDPNFIGARAGQTVGQIVTAILCMTTNATPLNVAGIGAYTSMSPPALPSLTTTDLNALAVIPPWRVSISGERLLLSLENFVQSCHPNHFLHVQPDGTIRFLDSRHFTSTTLTMGSDCRLGMPMLTRDASDSYSQVEIRGNTLVRGMALQTLPWPGSSAADGGLAEDFGYGSTSNAAAKAAWVPSDWSQPNQGIGMPLQAGACTMTGPGDDTTHVTITTTVAFTTNQLAQGSGQLLGQLLLYADSLGGNLQQIAQARILANTASTGSSGSYSCTCTLDIAMTNVSYNAYKLYGLAAGENLVGRRYAVTNAAIASAILTQFPYPVPFISPTGLAGDMTSTPIGTVMYNPFGGTGQPWNSASIGLTIDPVAGLIYFDMPTQVVAYGLNTPVKWAANVEAFVPVAVGTLTAYAPSSTTYAGTLYTVEGVQRRKVITVLEWRDYSNQSNMNIFAAEFLDSVKDIVVEGTVPYNGLATAYLVPGQAVSIAGHGYVTGWESLALPVTSIEVTFQNGPAGTSYLSVLHLSNRRGRYDASNFLRPNIQFVTFGADLPAEGFGTTNPESWAQSAQLSQQSQEMTAAATRGPMGFEGDRQAAAAQQQQRAFQDALQADPELRGQFQQQQVAQMAEQQRREDLGPMGQAAEDLGQMFAGAGMDLAGIVGAEGVGAGPGMPAVEEAPGPVLPVAGRMPAPEAPP